MRSKVMIGVCVEGEEQAEKFIRWLVGETAFEESTKTRPWFKQVETNMCIIRWMQPSRNFKASRLNYIYTTKEIFDSEWFKNVVRPMLVGGCGRFIDVEPEEGENLLSAPKEPLCPSLRR